MNYIKILAFCIISVNNICCISQEKGIIITDIDGNVYNTIKLGAQTWMKENLKVTHYSNGDKIETSNPDTLDLTSAVQPKYQWAYKNDSITAVYGRLYTWYVVVDKRNICPDGWHIPTDEEFCILENFIEPGIDTFCNNTDHRGKYIGNAMKEEGHNHWADPETGANNSSGFSGLPQVIRTYDGYFRYFGLYSYFWTKTEFDSKQAWSRRLYHDSSTINRGYYFKKDGLSVRCVKDE